MSLLLDALKKAELAKQIAKAESPTPETGTELAPPELAPRVITREKLPEITQPLEILTDDLPLEENAPEAPKARPGLSLQEPEAFAPAAPPSAQTGGPLHPDGRAQAEQLFQVKEMDYNPHRPFYLTLGALGLVAVAYGGYVWWQMQPHYALAPAAAPASAPSAPVQVAVAPATAPAPSSPPPSAAPAQTPPSAAAPAGARVAVVPPIQPVRPRQRSQEPAAVSTPGAAAARAEPSPAPPAPGPGQAGGPPIAVNVPISTVDPMVEQGYQAFQKNDLAAARESYQKALAREPRNRDALLGLAAIDVRSGELEAAESRYLKLLDMDPRDGQAVASLVALRGRLDPVASESRLKTLIAGQPESAHLHFSLGNQYAQQSRWPEAQAAYFKAYSIDPQNADYVFNLAVSLDQLRQRKPALDYYQRALALATKRAASFDSALARSRVEELSK